MSREDEIARGRERHEQNTQKAKRAAEIAAREAREEFLKAPGNNPGVDPEPVLLKPFIAATANPSGVDPTPKVVTLNETDEEREERMAEVLEREKAVMDDRQGATPDPEFDPNADENRRRQQAQAQADEQEAQRLRDEETARVKSRIKATVGTDDKGADESTKAKAAEAKKDNPKAADSKASKEADDKAGSGDTSALDALLDN